MPMDTDEVRRIAELARLDLDSRQLESLSRDLGTILDYVAALGEADQPDQAGPEEAAPGTTPAHRPPLRADRVGACLTVEQAVGQAPEASPEFFRVPKVLKG